jgi:hypothetical protein
MLWLVSQNIGVMLLHSLNPVEARGPLSDFLCKTMRYVLLVILPIVFLTSNFFPYRRPAEKVLPPMTSSMVSLMLMGPSLTLLVVALKVSVKMREAFWKETKSWHVIIDNAEPGGKGDSEMEGLDVEDSDMEGFNMRDGFNMEGFDMGDSSTEGFNMEDGKMEDSDMGDGSVGGSDTEDGNMEDFNMDGGGIDGGNTEGSTWTAATWNLKATITRRTVTQRTSQAVNTETPTQT